MKKLNRKIPKTIAIFLIIAQFFVGNVFLLPNLGGDTAPNIAHADTADAWYDSSWSYRKQIDITGSDADLTNYQVKLTVSYETGKMNADFSDLRFTNSDGTVLYDYYIESKTDSVSADVWVEIDSIPVAGTYIYIYHGNDSVASLSNKDDTLSKWTQTSDEEFKEGTASDSLIRNDGLDLDVDIDWTIHSEWTPTIYLYITLDFADLDNDGDKDALIGNDSGTSLAYKNTGTTSIPAWEREQSWDAPDIGGYASPSFVDLDNDNDYDIIIGASSGISYAYKNTGTNEIPIWTSESSWDLPDVGNNSYTSFADLDDDGDYDTLIGNYTGTETAYKNTGTTEAPVWTREASWDLGDTGSYTNASFADVDSDGDYDLFVLELAYENTGDSSAPIWTRNIDLDAPSSGYGDDPAFADLNNDGKLDVVLGERYGGTYAYVNTGTTEIPAWTREESWDLTDTSYYLDPAFADLDNDGDTDLLMGTRDGKSLGYKNTGSVSAPIWTREESWDLPDIGSFPSPVFVDIDNDGDYDVFLGENSGIIYGHENVGSITSPSWSAKASWNTVDTGRASNPAFADFDDDGDFDLVTGDYDGYSYGYKNIGDATSPVWSRYSAWDLPDEGYEASPIFIDLDNDSDLDVLIGNSTGTMHAYRNTGSSNVPFWERKETWDAADGGNQSTADLIDFDNDGLLDLMVGYQYTERRAYKNSTLYLSSGSFTSSSFDSTSLIKPQSISFGSTIPTDTILKFQLATNNDNTTWNFIGPDGTDATYYDEDEELTSEDLNDKRYLSYKVWL